MAKARMHLVAVAVVATACSFVGCSDDGTEPATATTSTPTTSLSTTTSSTTTSTTAGSSGAALDCGTVGFTPASEDAASQIKATGVSCEEARTFVEAAGARTSSGGPQRVTVNGYRCVLTRSVDDPLPYADYECTNGSKKITFTRS